MKHLVRSIALAAALLALATPALAQSRPLVTEDPETVPVGYILIETGIDFIYGVKYPASGLGGNLSRLGTFGVSFGVSSIAEIQIDGGLLTALNIKSMDPTAPLAPLYTGSPTATSTFEDVTIGAKIRFVSETQGRPAMAVRFATRLPLVGSNSGMSTGTTDVLVSLAIAKTVRSTRVAGNIGLSFLGDPERGDNHNELLAYGISVARAIATGAELVFEFHGRADIGDDVPPVGTESRGVARVGGRFTKGPVRIDGGLLLGLTENDPSWGVTFGVTWVFKAFELK